MVFQELEADIDSMRAKLRAVLDRQPTITTRVHVERALGGLETAAISIATLARAPEHEAHEAREEVTND